jgi:hypothetical protein
MTTLIDLAKFEDKRVGTDGGHMAGEYVMERMRTIGLTDVHMESFQFPRHVLASSSLALTVDGAAMSPKHEVFEGSGPGHADADVVWCGSAKPEDLAPLVLTGKVAMVERNASYHRSAQYKNVSEAGATGMLYLSQAPQNLIQIGSVRTDGWSPLGPIPTVTIGADDGAPLKAAAMAGKPLHAVIDVQASSTPATGNNVIGRIAGSDATGEIVLGAHYDTWFTGSGDNGGGIAALLALAERRIAHGGKPRYSLVFVAYDGEEVALYGGYDFLRKHRIVTPDPILAVLNFEIPAANNATQLGLGRSNHAPLDEALQQAGLGFLYNLYVPMEVVPMLLGGLIPTDIQGIYRNGVPTASTAVNFDYYHTTADTPDKVDVNFEGQVVDGFDDALGFLLADAPNTFAGLDPKLWEAKAVARARTAADPLVVDVTITDAQSTPQAGAVVDATLMVDDFFVAGSAHTMSDAAGQVTLTFPAAAAAMGSGNRFLHVNAGPSYPFVEQVLPIQ